LKTNAIRLVIVVSDFEILLEAERSSMVGCNLTKETTRLALPALKREVLTKESQ